MYIIVKANAMIIMIIAIMEFLRMEPPNNCYGILNIVHL